MQLSALSGQLKQETAKRHDAGLGFELRISFFTDSYLLTAERLYILKIKFTAPRRSRAI
jgi:hypothetical protein